MKNITTKTRSNTNVAEDLALAEVMQTTSGYQKDAAFSTVYSKYKQGCQQFVQSKIGYGFDSEDIVADSFIKVFEKINQFNPKTSALSTWIYTIVNNTLIDNYRKTKKEKEYTISLDKEVVITNDGETEKLDFPTYFQTPSEKLESKEIGFLINKAIENAIDDDMHREIFKLYMVNHLKLEEVSEELNLPLGTVKNVIHRSKKEIISYLRINFDYNSFA